MQKFNILDLSQKSNQLKTSNNNRIKYDSQSSKLQRKALKSKFILPMKLRFEK